MRKGCRKTVRQLKCAQTRWGEAVFDHGSDLPGEWLKNSVSALFFVAFWTQISLEQTNKKSLVSSIRHWRILPAQLNRLRGKKRWKDKVLCKTVLFLSVLGRKHTGVSFLVPFSSNTADSAVVTLFEPISKPLEVKDNASQCPPTPPKPAEGF